MESYLIETPKFKCRVDISEGIVIYSDPSLKWAVGKDEGRLFHWLRKTFPDFKKHKQEYLLEEAF